MTMLVNGLDPSTVGLITESIPGWRSAPALSRQTANVYGVPGGRVLDAGPLIAPRTLTINGTVRGTSAQNARDNLDQVQALFAAPILLVTFNDNSTRQVTCELQSFVVTPPPAQHTQSYLPVTITLLAYDPYAYDITASAVNPINATDTAIALGTAPVRPVLTLTATASVGSMLITVKNSSAVTIGTIGVTAAFVNTDVVVIDCLKRTITLNGASRLDLLSSGDFFELDVAKHGNYRLSQWPTLARSASITASASYKKAWR